jgi:hypothetical protein
MKPSHYREPLKGSCVFCTFSNCHPYDTYCYKHEVLVDMGGCCDDYQDDKQYEVQEL